MAAVIALRPNDERGLEILHELEKRTEMQPEQVTGGDTRTYYLSGEDADSKAFDPMLDKIDPDWRHHVTHWPPGS